MLVGENAAALENVAKVLGLLFLSLFTLLPPMLLQRSLDGSVSCRLRTIEQVRLGPFEPVAEVLGRSGLLERIRIGIGVICIRYDTNGFRMFITFGS